MKLTFYRNQSFFSEICSHILIINRRGQLANWFVTYIDYHCLLSSTNRTQKREQRAMETKHKRHSLKPIQFKSKTNNEILNTLSSKIPYVLHKLKSASILHNYSSCNSPKIAVKFLFLKIKSNIYGWFPRKE